jgi:nicotinate-nucleotide pyrophosphorylase (carboxylating)
VSDSSDPSCSIATTFGAAERAAARFLAEQARIEDLGPADDLTTRSLVSAQDTGRVAIVSRGRGVFAGLPVVSEVLAVYQARLDLEVIQGEGTTVRPGDAVARLTGALADLLIVERTILNFLSYLSGIASLTRRFVDETRGTRAEVFDTRKTLPGYRQLAKYAVRAGGGRNHRMGLYDQALVKDNHLAGWLAARAAESPTGARPGLDAVVRQVKQAAPGKIVEVEVDTLSQLEQVLAGPVDIVLLDNMPPPRLREAVALRDRMAPAVELEASGGVNLTTIRAIAQTGVERISVGALTHSPTILDLGFDWTGG